MKTLNVILLVTIASFLCAFTGYVVGISFNKEHLSAELSATQAMLSFNHLQRYQEIEACLENNNSEGAKLKANISIIQEKQLISDFLKSHHSAWLNDYINLRSDDNLESFINFNNRQSSWIEPEC